MKKPDEVEVKIAAADAASIRSALRGQKFRVHKPRVFEQNIVLDSVDAVLRNRDVLLRVRAAGRIVTCTFKGPGKPGAHKRREEREFHADSLDECLAFFRGLGYVPAFHYEKFRTEFTREGEPGIATLDETPIGVFMELEGPARWIDRTAKDLGFSRADYILSSYIGLYTDWCAEYGIQSTEMKFKKNQRGSS